METLIHMDGAILMFLQESVRNAVLDPIMKVITTLGNAGILWIVLTIFLLIPKKTRKIGWMSACALLFSLLINNILLKNLVARVRPLQRDRRTDSHYKEAVRIFFPVRSCRQFFSLSLCSVPEAAEEIRHPDISVCNPDIIFTPICRRTLSDRCPCRSDNRNYLQLLGRMAGQSN